MRRATLYLVVALLVAGCADAAIEPGVAELTAPVFNNAHSAAGGMGVHNFRTHLTGDEEVPANDSRAQGQAIFQLSADGSELSYRLIVANIRNVTQAHIHLAPADVNGPVVAWLYPEAPPAQPISGRVNGVLQTGVITEASLVGPLAGMSLEALMDAIRAGEAYVNVHTSQYPGGEVRGQIR